MFDLIHEMRSRIIKSPAFTGDKVIGAILFEMTMDREIDGVPTAKYLWENRHVVPFLKVDKGLAEPKDDVKLMKPIDGLDALLDRAVANGVFGTKMRSVIDGANAKGVAAIVAQQFEIGAQILGKGLVPILEPEVTISISGQGRSRGDAARRNPQGPRRGARGRGSHAEALPADKGEPLRDLVAHPKVMRVVALSGGYSRDEANAILARNTGCDRELQPGADPGVCRTASPTRNSTPRSRRASRASTRRRSPADTPTSGGGVAPRPKCRGISRGPRGAKAVAALVTSERRRFPPSAPKGDSQVPTVVQDCGQRPSETTGGQAE